MVKNDLAARMKYYEQLGTQQYLLPLLPTLARVDGRAFHSFTRGMDRPFDLRMQQAMVNTAVALAKQTNSCLAYTQSDEISLVWPPAASANQLWFGGRTFKMVSQLGAWATLLFYKQVLQLFPDRASAFPTFDARVWQTPTLKEAAKAVLWRELDARRNSISMAASTVYSQRELFGKSWKQQQEMLFEVGINWNDYPASFKRGTYVFRVKTQRKFTAEELERLPPKHEARQNPDMLVVRHDYRAIEVPPLSRIVNQVGFLFGGESAEVRNCGAFVDGN